MDLQAFFRRTTGWAFIDAFYVVVYTIRVSLRCFVVSTTKIIFPALGSLTGGLDAHHPEIMKSVGNEAAALVPVSNRLLRFPLAA